MSREAGATGNSDIDRKLADLEKKQGADFDRAYIDSMVDGHKDAIKLFEDASKNASDAEVKSFAATHLPTLQQHDEKAQQLKRTVRDAS
jgi:putative membrane protein